MLSLQNRVIAAAALILLCGALVRGQEESVRYLEVPLSGEVGNEITAMGVKSALNVARTKRATHVIFVLDTPGGRVEDARAIARTMDELRGDMTYYVIVKRALSAGIFVLSRADGIYFSPDSTAGAAVAYARSSSTGQVQVDAKFNAAMAAEVASAAAVRGQSPCIYRAMIITDASLFLVESPDGRALLSNERPADGHYRELDSPQTVFAPTAALAAEIGFGEVLPRGDIKGLEEWLGVKMQPVAPAAMAQVRDGARIVGERVKQGERAMETAQAQQKRINELYEHIPRQVKKAQDADPGKSTTYVKESGVMTPASQIKWRENTDRAVAEWNNVLHLISEIQRAEAAFDRAIADINTARAREYEARMYQEKPEPVKSDRPDNSFKLRDLSRTAQEKKAKLLADRSRTRI